MPRSPLFTTFQPHGPFCSLNLKLFLALKPLHWLFPLPEKLCYLLNTRMDLFRHSRFTLNVTYSETPPLTSQSNQATQSLDITSRYFNFLHRSYHSLSDISLVYYLFSAPSPLPVDWTIHEHEDLICLFLFCRYSI